MNDRFTFRFFNTETKKYMPAQYVDETSVFLLARLGGGKYIIEQCTGLKDKNGNLIYENDIIEIVGNGGKKLHFRVAVSDRNGGYYFPDAPLCYSFDFLDSHLYEVVGNVYENPELLEDK